MEGGKEGEREREIEGRGREGERCPSSEQIGLNDSDNFLGQSQSSDRDVKAFRREKRQPTTAEAIYNSELVTRNVPDNYSQSINPQC